MDGIIIFDTHLDLLCFDLLLFKTKSQIKFPFWNIEEVGLF